VLIGWTALYNSAMSANHALPLLPNADTDASERSAAARLLARPGRPRRRRHEDLCVRVEVDCRTKAGRATKELRAALLTHVGPKANAAQLALIAQALQLKLRLVLLDLRFLEAGGAMSAHDSRTYLAWSNSFVRLLRQLGLEAPADRPITLAEALAAGAAPLTAGTASPAPAASAPGPDALPPWAHPGATSAR